MGFQSWAPVASWALAVWYHAPSKAGRATTLLRDSSSADSTATTVHPRIMGHYIGQYILTILVNLC